VWKQVQALPHDRNWREAENASRTDEVAQLIALYKSKKYHRHDCRKDVLRLRSLTMAVFAVRDEEDIWGASAALIRHLLNYIIGQAGHRPYLLQVQNMFDWGVQFILSIQAAES
jgi:hypothetical protein